MEMAKTICPEVRNTPWKCKHESYMNGKERKYYSHTSSSIYSAIERESNVRGVIPISMLLVITTAIVCSRNYRR